MSDQRVDDEKLINEIKTLRRRIAKLEKSESEKIQTVQTLRESMEQIRFSFDRAAIGMALVSTDGNFLRVNVSLCEMLGYSKQTLLEKRIQQVIHPYDVDNSMRMMKRLMTGNFQHTQIEQRFIQRRGNIISILLTSSIVRNVKGDPLFVIYQFQDVTYQKRAEEENKKLEMQLRQNQKMEAIGRLAGGVAHDFNNLLTGIIGHADLVITSGSMPSVVSTNIKEIKKASKRASTLTQQLLAFSRRQVISPEVLDLNKTIQNANMMLERIIEEDVELRFISGQNLGKVKADPGQIEQILVNMVVNARDAMPNGGVVSIRTDNITLDENYSKLHPGSTPGAFVKLTISDVGIGIRKEIQDHIFEPFFTTKAKDKGTGLGLSTVYGIVKQNKGFIYVYSELGIGTSFKIYLPRVDDEETKKPKTTIMQIHPPRGSEIVLIVEDEDMVRGVASAVLERQGYAVHCAGDGIEAQLICEQLEYKIDLLLSDVIMPRMNGKELYHELKKSNPILKVLFMSGYAQDVIAHHGILEEGISFIQKPFTIEELAHKVREVCDSK